MLGICKIKMLRKIILYKKCSVKTKENEIMGSLGNPMQEERQQEEEHHYNY